MSTETHTPLYEPRSGRLTVQYQPDEETILVENPPRFTWIPALPENDRYMLQVSLSEDFPEQSTRTIRGIPYNFHTPDEVLQPGTYYWRYALELAQEGSTADRTAWSRVRRFSVPAGLPETPLPSREARYAQASEAHPRLWLQADELTEFRARIGEDPAYAGWDVFLERSVKPWMKRGLMAEPQPYPGNKRVAKLWRQMYMDCQEALYAVKHLSIAGAVLGDGEMTARAKAWLLHLAGWDPLGTTSRDYNDEAAFRVAGALAWGYDWLHGELTVEEREQVREALTARAAQVAFHVIERSKIHEVPFDSHAVRSLSSVLVPCSLALLGEEPRVREWLDYTLEYYAGLYTPWGGADGGWAEGPMYWTTGMAFVTEAMNLLRKHLGIDFYRRPFFTRTGDFPLYCFSPDTVRASFGDQSTLGDPVSLKTGFNIRQFAGVTGNPLYQWYYERVKETDTEAEGKFYNYGWWDFRFDDMAYRHDYPQVEAAAPKDGSYEPVKWFRDVGWVAFHSHMDDPQRHIMLLTKSSPYGSISHSHGDQNGFLLHAYGEPLAIESGYYIAFGSTMHREWRRQTRSTNSILIDGLGQYAGTDKVQNMAASGTVEAAERRNGYSYSRCDATTAYQADVPYLQRYIRELYFMDDSYIVVVDQVDLDQPARVDWLLQTLHEPKPEGQRFRVQGSRADLDGRFVYCSSGDLELTRESGFPGVDPAEIEGLAPHWHMKAATRMARSHRIVTLLVPVKHGEPKVVSYFMDDQDHGVHLYFTDNGITRRVEVPKAY
ncbi:DUF4962 domain-containing protein [Paenibacillus sp. S-38]|uniref:DUF4962 domain-containing protein n=1 Tax=Paenibacillus sp. S-38 TaxID=3416710 RepID=UPI003CF1E309